MWTVLNLLMSNGGIPTMLWDSQQLARRLNSCNALERIQSSWMLVYLDYLFHFLCVPTVSLQGSSAQRNVLSWAFVGHFVFRYSCRSLWKHCSERGRWKRSILYDTSFHYSNLHTAEGRSQGSWKLVLTILYVISEIYPHIKPVFPLGLPPLNLFDN